MNTTPQTEAPSQGPVNQHNRTPSGARLRGETYTAQQLAQFEYLDIKEAAALLRINHELIRKAIHSGELVAENYGSDRRPVYRIHRPQLDAWREARTVKAGGK